MQASKEYDSPAIEYRLAAEWEPHAATWLAWPHRKATWLGDFAPIPKVFEKVARLLAAYEPVRMIASGSVLEEARSSIGSVSNIQPTTLGYATQDRCFCCLLIDKNRLQWLGSGMRGVENIHRGMLMRKWLVQLHDGFK